MHHRDALPLAPAAAGIDLAADRRRPGRPDTVPPSLVPLLRGEFDVAAPPDPVLPGSPARLRTQQFVLGGSAVGSLLLVGALFRFAI